MYVLHASYANTNININTNTIFNINTMAAAARITGCQRPQKNKYVFLKRREASLR